MCKCPHSPPQFLYSSYSFFLFNSTTGAGKHYVKPDEPNFPKSTEKFRWSPLEIENMLRSKLIGLCKRPEEQFQTAYLLFGRPKFGITLSVFLRVCRKLGMSLTPEEGKMMMSRYDDDGSGDLDFVEFCNGIMGVDYPRKTWNQKRGEQIQNDTIAKRMNVDVKVIEKHQDGIIKFKRKEKQNNKEIRRKKENDLQEKLSKSLARSQRLEKRREKQKRARSAPRGRRTTTRVRGGGGGGMQRRSNNSSGGGGGGMQKRSDESLGMHMSLEQTLTIQGAKKNRPTSSSASASKRLSKTIRPMTAGRSSPSCRLSDALKYDLKMKDSGGAAVSLLSLSSSASAGVLLKQQQMQSNGARRRRRPRTAHGIGSLIRSSRRSLAANDNDIPTHDFGWK